MNHKHARIVKLIYYSDSLLQAKVISFTSRAGVRRSNSVLRSITCHPYINCINAIDLLPESLVYLGRLNSGCAKYLLLPWMPSALLLLAILHGLALSANHKPVFLVYNYPASLLPVLPILAALRFKIVLQVEEITNLKWPLRSFQDFRNFPRWLSMLIWLHFSSSVIAPYKFKTLSSYTKPVLIAPLI
jgi:hypothetical protein